MEYYPAISVIEIDRVQKAGERFGTRFLTRLFTGRELGYCLPRPARYRHLAARLAAKIALRCALRAAGLRPPAWGAIEVRGDEWGKPFIKPPRSLPRITILVSLSHSRRLAASSVIVSVDH